MFGLMLIKGRIPRDTCNSHEIARLAALSKCGKHTQSILQLTDTFSGYKLCSMPHAANTMRQSCSSELFAANFVQALHVCLRLCKYTGLMAGCISYFHHCITLSGTYSRPTSQFADKSRSEVCTVRQAIATELQLFLQPE